MKKILISLMILMVPSVIITILMAFITFDYWSGGHWFADTLAGQMNNGFAAIVFTVATITFAVMWFFLLFIVMDYDAIKKTQAEIDTLRGNYRKKDEQLDKLITQYNKLIINPK